MLDKIVDEHWFKASAVLGFWPANARGDDILVYGDEVRDEPIAVLHSLRQQLSKREGRANGALSDFIAPRESGLADYIGGFTVTAGIGEDEVAERFKRANDDYSAIMPPSEEPCAHWQCGSRRLSFPYRHEVWRNLSRRVAPVAAGQARIAPSRFRQKAQWRI